MFVCPSSSEYSEWTWRWTQGEALIGPDSSQKLNNRPRRTYNTYVQDPRSMQCYRARMGHRERLMVGARRCLEERGYARTTSRDVAAAAEAPLGAVNYHFGSK